MKWVDEEEEGGLTFLPFFAFASNFFFSSGSTLFVLLVVFRLHLFCLCFSTFDLAVLFCIAFCVLFVCFYLAVLLCFAFQFVRFAFSGLACMQAN